MSKKAKVSGKKSAFLRQKGKNVKRFSVFEVLNEFFNHKMEFESEGRTIIRT